MNFEDEVIHTCTYKIGVRQTRAFTMPQCSAKVYLNVNKACLTP